MRRNVLIPTIKADSVAYSSSPSGFPGTEFVPMRRKSRFDPGFRGYRRMGCVISDMYREDFLSMSSQYVEAI
ncbi:hypothetical protein GA0061078_1251 [Bifidobacterium bohemicum]|nr:hypothetical protein GA0061078_1251 [Bifidobacterium bohemicum]